MQDIQSERAWLWVGNDKPNTLVDQLDVYITEYNLSSQIDNFNSHGSGWDFDNIVRFELVITKYHPLCSRCLFCYHSCDIESVTENILCSAVALCSSFAYRWCCEIHSQSSDVSLCVCHSCGQSLTVYMDWKSTRSNMDWRTIHKWRDWRVLCWSKP